MESESKRLTLLRLSMAVSEILFLTFPPRLIWSELSVSDKAAHNYLVAIFR